MGRSRWLVAVVLAAVVSLGAGCGSDADEPDGAVTDTTASGSTSTTAASTDGSTTTDGTPTSTTVAPDPLQGATEDPQAGQAQGDAVAVLADVRTARNPGFDRIVFEFRDDDLPAWTVAYADGPFTQDGSGNPVSVDGEAFLAITMQGASAFDMEAGEVVYDGPNEIAGNGTTRLVELVGTGDFEALMSWVAGLDRKEPFKVSTLTAPTRLVIDIAHGS